MSLERGLSGSHLVLGIDELDAQHRRILSLLDHLEAEIGFGPGHPATRAAVSDLVSYVNNHFFVEESLMRILGYPDYDIHLADHVRLREELDEFRLGAFNVNVAAELIELFRVRFNDHVELLDRQYTRHFQTTAIPSAARHPRDDGVRYLRPVQMRPH